jgi:hypothetical protein
MALNTMHPNFPGMTGNPAANGAQHKGDRREIVREPMNLVSSSI